MKPSMATIGVGSTLGGTSNVIFVGGDAPVVGRDSPPTDADSPPTDGDAAGTLLEGGCDTAGVGVDCGEDVAGRLLEGGDTPLGDGDIPSIFWLFTAFSPPSSGSSRP